jgi:hypothetical protein
VSRRAPEKSSIRNKPSGPDLDGIFIALPLSIDNTICGRVGGGATLRETLSLARPPFAALKKQRGRLHHHGHSRSTDTAGRIFHEGYTEGIVWNSAGYGSWPLPAPH